MPRCLRMLESAAGPEARAITRCPAFPTGVTNKLDEASRVNSPGCLIRNRAGSRCQMKRINCSFMSTREIS
ncbi:uncharacterized [Tachysurus ichikawai]